MEFKFRAIDGQASTSIPPPLSIGYFTEQARRGYLVPDFGRSTEFFRNPSNVREAIQRELEKERIREEIIAAEIVRMCRLEAAARMKMALGREIVRREEGFSVFSGPAATSAMRFVLRPSLLHQSEGRLLEERLALSLEERLANPEGNLSGAKRKAMTPPAAAASELPSGSLKKILKEEWSCSLCQVKATSKRCFDEHFQGKKHKAMAAGP